MVKEFCIGNIVDVKWSYRDYIIRDYYQINEDKMPKGKIDYTMDPNKSYACISIENDKFFIRNEFDSKDIKGFDQKNTYFEDIGIRFYNLRLDDKSNLIEKYLSLYNETLENNSALHICVEYEPRNDLHIELISYCAKIEHEKLIVENELRIIQSKIDIKRGSNERRSWFSFW